MRRRLHAMGLRYRVDLAPLPNSRRLRADIVFTRAHVAVFIDGCFWHGCPEHYRLARVNAEFWATKIAANQRRDARFEAALVTGGWTVLRFWEHDPSDRVADVISRVVRSARESLEISDRAPADERQADLDTAKKSILDSLEMVDSKEVARILAPTSEANRSVAQKRRAAGDLIGLPIGTRPNYLYPAFQFDTQRHKIHDVVRHANRRLYVDRDPYGAASWWLTPVDFLDGNCPLEDLEAGNLTVIAVDNVIDHARQGM